MHVVRVRVCARVVCIWGFELTCCASLHVRTVVKNRFETLQATNVMNVLATSARAVRVRVRRTGCASLYLGVAVRNRVETPLHATNVMNVAANALVTCVHVMYEFARVRVRS